MNNNEYETKNGKTYKVIKMFHDDYNIDEQYQTIRRLFLESEADIYKFIGRKKNKDASFRARDKLVQIKKMLPNLINSMRKQRQDNSSQY